MSGEFEPIAVVGRGCVLPGALHPDDLWRNVLAGRVSLAPAPVDGRPGGGWGGHIDGFDDVFTAEGLRLPAAEITGLGPVFRWVLHGVRQALREAGQEGLLHRGELVLGNLSYPTTELAAFAEHVWLGEHGARWSPAGPRPDARNRFSSGLPASLAAAALGLGGGGFALDAACASSLYAVKIACDRLRDRAADLVVAGGVNGADDRFVHEGFAELAAISPTGRSRPFHRAADGLVPAQGAGFVALMRLPDAVAAGARIHGVIRGVGLSNDGRGAGLLVPDARGQERALRLAYASAGVAPETVSLLECHATGTRLGDEVEVRGSARVFEACRDLPIGSVKSNLGHLVTSAGAAGLLKVLGALQAGVRPPTLGADDPLDALAGTPLRPLHEAEEWRGPRRAAISAFGFGGNNAHLVIDAWTGETTPAVAPPVARRRPEAPEVAVVALGARVAGCGNADELRAALFAGAPAVGAIDEIEIDLTGLRFPPADLEQTRAQQTLLLETARAATRTLSLPRERTAVLVGMGVDAEVARYHARWRAGSWSCASGAAADPDSLDAARAAIGLPLSAAAVLGAMPNMVANRLNTQLDLAGPSHTVSAEEASGLVALELAGRALRAGECDAVVVGAVDLSCEPVHLAALSELGGPGERAPACDAAVVLVLKRLADARRDGDPVLALLGDQTKKSTVDTLLVVGDGEEAGYDPGAVFGRAHAASGLVAAACAVLSVHHRMRPRVGERAGLALAPFGTEVVCEPLAGPPVRARLLPGDHGPVLLDAVPRPFVFSGADRDGVLAALDEARRGAEGPARLVVLAQDDGGDLAARSAAARRWLTGDGPRPEGVAFRDRPLAGELAFVFPNGAAAYPDMARAALAALPDVVDEVALRCGPLEDVAGWAYAGNARPSLLDRIWGAAFVGHFHSVITLNLLGLTPSAAIGYCSGEPTALTALGAWPDIATFVRDTRRSELFRSALVGERAAVRRAWRRAGIEADGWEAHLVNARPERVRAALAGEQAVHLVAVNTPEACVIAGEPEGCLRVLGALGVGRSFRLPYDIAVHVPELAEVRQEWHDLHHRPTHETPGIRFYNCATGESYLPGAERAADSITTQALTTIDFVTAVERAWADGVRIFVEHGPKSMCTNWIRGVLGDREYLAVGLDQPGDRTVAGLLGAVAELVAAGVPVKTGPLLDRLTAGTTAPPQGEARRWVTRTRPRREPLPSPASPARALDRAPALAPAATAPVAEEPQVSPDRHMPDHYRRLAEVHRDFLVRQAAVHARFLRTMRHLAETTGGVAELPPCQPVAAPPLFTRPHLEQHATGVISELFGAGFRAQDGHHRQTRLPAPPMLLVDRVTALDAAPLTMGTGTVRTESDVLADGWYLDATGRMPPGLTIECGQADLFLISWLGVDLLNRGERVYRLLGCEVTFHGPPPVPGETLRYEITVDGHGEHDGVRIFFFHYDCWVGDELRLSMRDGQAGFFTDEELAAGAGVRWDPAQEVLPAASPAPPVLATARGFGPDQVAAFTEGRPADCFGEPWSATRAHVRTPRLPGGRLRLLHEVPVFDPHGGPWGRGYLRAETPVSADDWFFDGHFHHDPCMPGTLMLDGCLQAMAFYLTASGCTVDRDGWRFEPVPGLAHRMVCRSQVTPESGRLVYEVFVVEVTEGPEPVLVADVLCTVDGVRAFHVRRAGVRLVPDWPLSQWRLLGPPAEQLGTEVAPLSVLAGLVGHREPRPVAIAGGVAQDRAAMLAYAWGKPSEAFGPAFRPFDGARRLARLPGPPYLFLNRVVEVVGEQGQPRVGSRVVAEYDVPPGVWYLAQNGDDGVPLSVLMEIALQPCGWLAAYLSDAAARTEDLLFRNLDGTLDVLGRITAATTTVRVRAELRSVTRDQDMTIETFDVSCRADGTEVLRLTTVFGFFPAATFAQQVGLPTADEDRRRVTAPAGHAPVELGAPVAGVPAAGPALLMLDRVTGYWPDGGRAGLGLLRGEKTVDAGEWYFAAHFFQDPVQPGSLGVEAAWQLLRHHVLAAGYAEGVRRPRFEPIVDDSISWRYRGQVVPRNRVITVEVEVTGAGEDDRGRYVLAEAWLWVDGLRIYHVSRLGMRISEGGEPECAAEEQVVDVTTRSWLLDHRPNWTVPALPLMSMVDVMAAAAARWTGREVAGLRDVTVRRWLPLTRPVRLRTEVTLTERGVEVRLLVWRDAATEALSRFEPVADALVLVGPSAAQPPPPLPELVGPRRAENPYAGGHLTHGPAFQYLVELWNGANGASATLDAGRGTVPRGLLHQGLLDALTHAIPHDRLPTLTPKIPAGLVAYPHRIERLDLFGRLPDTGELRLEVRFGGFDGDHRLRPAFDVQLLDGGRPLLALRLVEALVPIGPLGDRSPEERRSFLCERRYTAGIGLSVATGNVTVLDVARVEELDWLPGTVADLYALPPGEPGRDHLATIAVRDHLARRLRVHPCAVVLGGELGEVLAQHGLRLTQSLDRVIVEG